MLLKMMLSLSTQFTHKNRNVHIKGNVCEINLLREKCISNVFTDETMHLKSSQFLMHVILNNWQINMETEDNRVVCGNLANCSEKGTTEEPNPKLILGGDYIGELSLLVHIAQ